ncbi:MAG: hypothetical protein IJ736_13825, partial [Firmicutes bacterium]|nr:hypothetical protein [Bacillota bacterium]
MKRFLTVAVVTVLASSLLVACSDSSTSTDSASTGSDTKVETPADGEGNTEAPVEEEKELDAEGLLAEVDNVQALYESCADAAKAAGDEEEYAALGEQIADLLNTIAEKGDDLTQEDIDLAEDTLAQVNEALAAYGVAVGESAADALNTLDANIKAVDGYYAELKEIVEAAHADGSLTDESYDECVQYGADLEDLGTAIGTALQSDDTTIEDVNQMNDTLVSIYEDLQEKAEETGAEIATIQLIGEEMAAQAEAEASEEAEAE